MVVRSTAVAVALALASRCADGVLVHSGSDALAASFSASFSASNSASNSANGAKEKEGNGAASAILESSSSSSSSSSKVLVATKTTMESSLRMQYLQRRDREHKQLMERLMSNITTTAALDEVLPRSKPELKSFIQTSIVKKGHLRSGSGSGALYASDSKESESGLQRAVDMLNEMIEESQEKYDLEVEKCCAYDMYQSTLMEQARQDISKFNAEAAEARACILEQDGVIGTGSTQLPILKEALESHNAQCKKDIHELEEVIKIVTFDIGIMDDILKIIGTCEGEDEYTTTPMPAEFIQLVQKKPAFLMQRCLAQGEDGSTCAFFQFEHGSVQSALSQLKSDKARALVQDNLNELHERELEDADASSNSSANASEPASQIQWELVLADISVDNQDPIDIGEKIFNDKFERSAHKILKRVCPDCDEKYKELYYKRISPIGGFSAYTSVAKGWGEESAQGAENEWSNKITKDFNIYSDEYDAINDKNAWTEFDGAALAANGKGYAFFVGQPPAWTPETLPKQTLLRGRPCKLPKATNKQSSKCTPSPPNCLKMKERFEYIRAGMQDTKAELEEELDETKKDCETETANIGAQIAGWESKLRDAQNKLAVCTGTANYNDEQSRLKSVELAALIADYAKMTKECHANYALHEGDICAVKKIRTELKKIRNPTGQTFFVDCVVGEWVPGECSQTCGDSGVMTLSREVMTPPVFGAKCPALQAVETCNRHKCPIDCKLDVWHEWSGCTAKCGGGIKERTRDVKVEPMHGGEPCGETSESESCNIQACDKDCVLFDWTPWSECSKECNGGHLVHYRRIQDQVVGNGHCPKWWEPTRLGITECNMFPCEPNIKCASSLDVVLVIDGSGSLGPSGWAASKKAGAMLARAFGGSNTGSGDTAAGPVMLSVILFSYWSEVKAHFTYDTEAAAQTIENLQWPRSLTYTSQALNLAKDELQMGRADANSIVIVITDGRPMSERNTKQAAKWLRKSARLMFVPVTRWAPLASIKQWASFPREENIVQVNDFAELETPAVADKIIADACEHLLETTTTTTTVAE